MSTDDHDDPGADTAMFRAFVDEGNQPGAAPATNRTAVIAVGAVVVVLLLVVLLIAMG